MEPLSPVELNPDSIEQFLDNSEIVYFDGRLTEAAMVVAKKAREKNIKVLITWILIDLYTSCFVLGISGSRTLET